jgi:hypothetical protein
MDHRLHATSVMAEAFHRIFVNRRAYTLQSAKPHPDTGQHYYYRPKARAGEAPPGLAVETVRQHLSGEITLGIYAINPSTQGSKWVAIDADYKNALEDLLKLQYKLKQDGIEPALEKSNRGGHLWIFLRGACARARLPRLYLPRLCAFGFRLKGPDCRKASRSFHARTSSLTPSRPPYFQP